MLSLFKIHKSFRIRHKILGVLYEDWNESKKDDQVVGSIRIADKANVSVSDIHTWQGSLVEKGEITSSDNDGQIMMSIQLAGRNAYIQNKYLKEGRKEKWDNIFDWARILIPLALLILSIVNYISNRSLNSRLNKVEQKLEKTK